MVIASNTTGMEAGLSVSTDKHGRDACSVAVKGTFTVDRDGVATLADEQAPLVYADVHYGDPATSSIQYACDFVPRKPAVDVLVVGRAFAPGGRRAETVTASLRVGSLRKTILVTGDRSWERGFFGLRPSRPVPFESVPITYERAFGGCDVSHAEPREHGFELRNLCGVGYHKNRPSREIAGTPLPNIEDPEDRVASWSSKPRPVGLGVIHRNWLPRIGHAGTYDARWMDVGFPFLPEDFDERYYQSAPEDQQLSELRGGERVSCVNLSSDGLFEATIPSVNVPVTFRFRDRDAPLTALLDTAIIEPDARRLLLTWRATVPLGRKLHALREIAVGASRRSRPPSSKPHFKSIDELVQWKKQRRRS